MPARRRRKRDIRGDGGKIVRDGLVVGLVLNELKYDLLRVGIWGENEFFVLWIKDLNLGIKTSRTVSDTVFVRIDPKKFTRNSPGCT